jgi:lipoate synthase
MKGRALAFGFRQVEAGPLVRSSYRAHEMWDALRQGAA